MKKLILLSLTALVCLSAAARRGMVMTQNTPNPFNGTTEVCLCVAHAGEVTLTIADIYGHIETICETALEAGTHRFQLTLAGKGTYLLAARQGDRSASVTLFCTERGRNNSIAHIGYTDEMLYMDDEADETDDMEDTDELNASGTAAKASSSEPFRVALSLSPFTLNQFDAGYTFKIGDRTATTPAELQQIYRDLGSTEMYVRLATKRHKTYKADGTPDNTTDGKPDENANVHTFDQVMQTCRIAAALDIPINPEVMCAYIYMDMDGTQAPRFYKSDYPELYANPTFASIMKNGEAKWEELSLQDICTVLEIYGEFVGDSILATGCTVNDWNLGNEANFGFAGIGIGMPNSFDRKLAKAGAMKRYMSSLFGLAWLKNHVWKYEAQTLAAVQRGIRKAYTKAGKDMTNVKFSTHIATVVATPRACASFFTYMNSHGYDMQTAGISYYPSAPAMSFNKWKLYTKTVTRINKKCHIPVFIGEFSYPSQDMVGPFAGWNSQLSNYGKDQQGQQAIYQDVIAWGKQNGLIGIRYWAPDYEGEWYPMSMFEFDSNKVGTAKQILINHKEIVQ